MIRHTKGSQKPCSKQCMWKEYISKNYFLPLIFFTKELDPRLPRILDTSCEMLGIGLF